MLVTFYHRAFNCRITGLLTGSITDESGTWLWVREIGSDGIAHSDNTLYCVQIEQLD